MWIKLVFFCRFNVQRQNTERSPRFWCPLANLWENSLGQLPTKQQQQDFDYLRLIWFFRFKVTDYHTLCTPQKHSPSKPFTPPWRNWFSYLPTLKFLLTASISRLADFSFKVSRLSKSFFPFPIPISTLTRLPLKYTLSGTIVNPFSETFCLKRDISVRFNRSFLVLLTSGA